MSFTDEMSIEVGGAMGTTYVLGQRSLGSTKSNGQSIPGVLMPGDMLNMLLYP